ncbi:hypothetical protein BD560DRAFT_466995 [Blakeslea trispora]|nr:hypothetical protein BD560DRAFT_466995 [Blakeslea trispora]
MNQVQAMFFLAASWLEVKPETIKNCWRHTRILESKEDEMVEPPTTALPLEQEIVDSLNCLIPQLPGNQNETVKTVSDLDLNVDEAEMMLVTSVQDAGDEEALGEEEEEDIFYDVEATKKRLRECYEFILNHDIPEDDIETSMHRRYRRRIAAARAEVINAREQTN